MGHPPQVEQFAIHIQARHWPALHARRSAASTALLARHVESSEVALDGPRTVRQETDGSLRRGRALGTNQALASLRL